MNKVLEDLGYQKNPNFKEVFNTEMSKKVTNTYWKKLIKERNLGLFSISISIKDILRTLFLANKKLKPKQAIYLLGLFMLAKDENGMRQLRTIISKRSHDRTWYRIAKDMQEASELITKNKIRDWVTQIDNALEDYKPYKIKKYEKNT
jgi:D-arabinose 1-dehydrogenase-like Zn-dependent alcohol dehydrogenase